MCKNNSPRNPPEIQVDFLHTYRKNPIPSRLLSTGQETACFHLGLPEGHEDWRLIARYSRKEEQHQDIPGPVGRAAQVAGKTVREVRDPRFLPVGFEVFNTLDHQLRQSGCYGIYQILVFHGWMGLERLKTGRK